MFKNFLKEYFTFSSSARRGIWALIVLIIMVFCIPYIYKFFKQENGNNCFGKNDINEFDNAFIHIKKSDSLLTTAIPIVPFDPNKLTKTDWIKYGINAKSAENIIKYLSKGGRFYSLSDIKKIYGIDTIALNKLSNAMIFPKKEMSFSKQKITNLKTEIKTDEIIELNTSDSIILLKLPGIGAKTASRIIKYRDLLGGYYSLKQLLEVYGLTQQNYSLFIKQVQIDTTQIRKIKINQATEIEFRKHPYILKYKASLIIKYRKFKGKIQSFQELLENGIFTPDEFRKVMPYLEVQ